ncbi:MAG: hypothetical protein BGN86_12415 [Caulobacterales bacterium 68-7]|nr:MAG: hypothetical protein BGN86_12415 [Caulobacterales bacterium 68-7]
MSQREAIEPRAGDKRYVRRDDEGRFTDGQVDVGEASAHDQRQHAKATSKPGYGDKGDRRGS